MKTTASFVKMEASLFVVKAALESFILNALGLTKSLTMTGTVICVINKV